RHTRSYGDWSSDVCSSDLLIESKEAIYLASVVRDGENFGASFLELSAGHFSSTQITGKNAWEKIREEIQAFSPRELLFPRSLERSEEHTSELQSPYDLVCR